MAAPDATRDALESFDLATGTVRELNRRLHGPAHPQRLRVLNPSGRHSIAVGLDGPHEVEIEGHVGYYCAGMNKLAAIRVRGNCGVGVAENMMSGSVIVEGSASQSAGATARGGLLVIHGDASARCGISRGRPCGCLWISRPISKMRKASKCLLFSSTFARSPGNSDVRSSD